MAAALARNEAIQDGERTAADVERAMARNDALVNGDLIRQWLLWGFFWTMLAPTVVVTFLALVWLTVQFLMTIARRAAPPLYVSLWYLIAAFVWTDVNLVLLMLGPESFPGINNAAWHGLFIHYVVGLWITPAGYVLIYYDRKSTRLNSSH